VEGIPVAAECADNHISIGKLPLVSGPFTFIDQHLVKVNVGGGSKCPGAEFHGSNSHGMNFVEDFSEGQLLKKCSKDANTHIRLL
jgi:hypothetical protein